MVAEAKVVCQQSVPVLDVEYFAKNVHEVEDVVAVTPSISSPKSFDLNRASEPVSAAALLSSQAVSFPILKFPAFGLFNLVVVKFHVGFLFLGDHASGF